MEAHYRRDSQISYIELLCLVEAKIVSFKATHSQSTNISFPFETTSTTTPAMMLTSHPSFKHFPFGKGSPFAVDVPAFIDALCEVEHDLNAAHNGKRAILLDVKEVRPFATCNVLACPRPAVLLYVHLHVQM